MAQALGKEVSDLRKIQKELARIESMIQDYVLKKHENEMVRDELQLVTDGNVYKLIGPALIPQKLDEARGNVDKRLEFINKEITRLDKLKADFLKKNEEKQEKIMKMQKDLGPRGK
ncbi:hypothetical protein SteCoe_22724 [Stentor coeruleus]|uniref:Prefoldin subunit 6 n=1 Tax=Stentor coeruleus TaxID=5963 RepID=A0A1R2BLD5_9CILI|nr:hypothetical protein SteCoe_22724 [Stentor coeruleus]